MSNEYSRLRAFRTIVLILTLGVTMNACSSDTVSWKEEVALHNGSKIIVTRSHTYGRQGELGQGRLIAESLLTFQIPGTSEVVSLKTDGVLGPLSIDFKDGVPYVAAIPGNCISFFQWGQPHPPYVFFRYDRVERKWQRITIDRFPEGFNTNLIVGTKNAEEKIIQEMHAHGFVLMEKQKQLNDDQSDFIKNISRIEIKSGPGTYGECQS